MIKDREYVKEAFEYLHAHAENGFEEYETSAYIAKQLEKFGYEVKTNLGGATGVLGILDSKVPGPVLGIRADMDALGYEIDGKIEYRHTCGHDAHSAMALAMAKEIKERGIKTGKLYVIFQPAEEKLTGAFSVIKSGEIDDITEAVGIHVRPIEDTTIGHASPALYHCASTPLTMEIKGKTAHGSRPHLGINAAEVAVSLINEIKAIKVNPMISHSIKVTQINVKSGAVNIIPDEAQLGFDIRCADNGEMKKVLEKLNDIIRGVEQIYGATVELKIIGTTLASIYDEDIKKTAAEAIKEVLGDEGLIPDIHNPGGEDFHFITDAFKCKSTVIGLGADVVPGTHHKDMKFNHDCLYDGAEILLRVVEKRLGFFEY